MHHDGYFSMKLFSIVLFLCISTLTLAKEGDRLIDLLRKGNAQHDVGNYEKALEFYKKALKIDSTSGIVHYEIAYSLMALKRYEESAQYSRRVIDLNSKQQQGAYVMLGSALNLMGSPQEAIKVYLEGLTKFSGLHQLHYNLALAYFDVDNLNKAEEVLYHSLQMKPAHINSHLLLSKIMSARGQSIKAILPLYYVLYLDQQLPNAKEISNMLYGLMDHIMYVQDSTFMRKNEIDTLFASAVDGVMSAQKTNSDDSSFSTAECTFFASLKDAAQKAHPLWSDLYATLFYQLYDAGHCEAFAYMIDRMSAAPEAEQWLRTHPSKVQALQSWIDAHQPPQKMNQVLFGTSDFR